MDFHQFKWQVPFQICQEVQEDTYTSMCLHNLAECLLMEH